MGSARALKLHHSKFSVRCSLLKISNIEHRISNIERPVNKTVSIVKPMFHLGFFISSGSARAFKLHYSKFIIRCSLLKKIEH